MHPPTFVDRVVLHLSGGKGGNGVASVHREKFRPLGGPDGGNGGNGGHVVLRVDAGLTTLLDYHHRPHRRAGNGTHGSGSHRNGRDGADLVLPVPEGTLVRTDDGELVADLVGAGTEMVIAAGGRGGLGNAALASARRKAPGFALLGEPGADRTLTLELKVLADVGLVGFPSAGKSSLVAAMSRARPEVADYPFTTLTPHLGVVAAGETTFTVADVPGLIQGASLGRGLGQDFLRHVERCSALVHVVDTAALESARDPVTDIDAIERELAAYGGLADRPRLVALNKVDVPDGREMVTLVEDELRGRGLPVFAVSAATHEGLAQLSYAMADLVRRAREQRPASAPARPVLQPSRQGGEEFTVCHTEDGWRVRGGKPERWVAQTDFANDEAVGYLADRLNRLGVEERLLQAGASPGDPVLIGPDSGPVVFDFDPDVTAGAELLGRRGEDTQMDEDRPAVRRRRAIDSAYHEGGGSRADVARRYDEEHR